MNDEGLFDDNLLFNELLKQELNNSSDDDDNICLISREPLNKIYITLECGHKFNYKNIYNEICIQKTKYNKKEVQKLTKNSIKCPYCRHVQNKLLPYVSGYKKIKFVNSPLKYCMTSPFLTNTCKYKFKSGKHKNEFCGNNCENEYCNRHLKLMNKKKQKEEEKKKQKEEEKKKQKSLKEIIIDLEQKIQEEIQENTIIVPELNKCKHILSRGINKGKQCQTKINIQIHTNGLCNKCSKLKKYQNIYVTTF